MYVNLWFIIKVKGLFWAKNLGKIGTKLCGLLKSRIQIRNTRAIYVQYSSKYDAAPGSSSFKNYIYRTFTVYS
jgi:hypothetical protein